MTTSTPSLIPANGTDAEFRAWGSGIAAALAAVGLVQTADTGQINWTTVLRPTAAAQMMGYEIWRFSDTLQATKPVFLKISYGAGTANGLRPGLQISVGTGSNGAGALTGNTSATAAIEPSGNSASAFSSYISDGDGSLLNIVFFPGVTGSTVNTPCVFSLDRLRNSDGTPNGNGLYLWVNDYSASGVACWYQVIPFHAGYGPLTKDFNAPVVCSSYRSNANTGVVDLVVSLLPHQVCSPKAEYPPAAVYSVFKDDAGASLTTITATSYGAARTFLLMAGRVINAGYSGATTTGGTGTVATNLSVALRFD